VIDRYFLSVLLPPILIKPSIRAAPSAEFATHCVPSIFAFRLPIGPGGGGVAMMLGSISFWQELKTIIPVNSRRLYNCFIIFLNYS
jgi:hypothetical protein